MQDVTVGSDDWNVVQYQWQDYPENTYDYFGEHTANPCGIDTNATPTVGFGVDDIVAFEGDVLRSSSPSTCPSPRCKSRCLFSKGAPPRRCRISARCFRLKSPSPQGWLAAQSFTVGIVDDVEPEGLETFTLVLTVLSGNAEVATSELTVSIAPSDLGFHYPIADVRGH